MAASNNLWGASKSTGGFSNPTPVPGIAQAMAPAMGQTFSPIAPAPAAAAIPNLSPQAWQIYAQAQQAAQQAAPAPTPVAAPTPAAQAIPNMSAQAWQIYAQAQQAQQAAQQAAPAPASIASSIAAAASPSGFTQAPVAAPAVTTPAPIKTSAPQTIAEFDKLFNSNPGFQQASRNYFMNSANMTDADVLDAYKAAYNQFASNLDYNPDTSKGKLYGTAGLVSGANPSQPWSDLGYSNPGIRPAQTYAQAGQDEAYARLQEKYPGYFQTGDPNAYASGMPGDRNFNLVGYMADPSKVTYDPEFGYIAPGLNYGQAGAHNPFMQNGGAILAAIAAAPLLAAGGQALGSALSGGEVAGSGGASGLAGGGSDAILGSGFGSGLQATALPSSTNAMLGEFLGQSLVPTASTVGAPLGGGFSSFLSSLPVAAGAVPTSDFVSNGLQASVSPTSANAAIGDFLGQSLVPSAASVGAPLGGGFEAFLAGLGGVGSALSPSIMDVLSTPTPGAGFSPAPSGAGLQASIVPGTTANEALGDFLGASLTPTAASTGSPVGSLLPASLTIAPQGNWLQRAFGSLYNDPAGTLFNKLDDPDTLLRLLGLGSSLASSFMGSNAIKDAAKNAAAAADPYAAQRPAQAGAFNQTLAAGPGAGRAAELTANPNLITQLPNYQWNMDQGLDAINRKAAATGNLESGNRLLALQKYAQGYAADQYGAEFGRRAQLDDQAYRDWLAKLNATGQASGAYNNPATAAGISASGNNAAIQTMYGGINDVLDQVFNPRVQNQQSLQDELLRQLRAGNTLW